MLAHARTRAVIIRRAAWTFRRGRLFLAAGLALVAAACAPAPPPPLAGPDPADPNVPVPPAAYRSPIPASAPRRPVEPSAWQGGGDGAAPAAKP
jgi:hypothetical protein